MFGIIIEILKFNQNNKEISGIFIKRMKQRQLAFNTQYINQVIVSNELLFIEESELIKPAVQIFGHNKLYVIKQANCWETD